MFIMASFSENYVYIRHSLYSHTYINIYFEKRHKSSQISKKQICLLSATAVGQMVKLEMFVVVMRFFPFDQDATSMKDI
jgi:hypothetical protein